MLRKCYNGRANLHDAKRIGACHIVLSYAATPARADVMITDNYTEVGIWAIPWRSEQP